MLAWKITIFEKKLTDRNKLDAALIDWVQYRELHPIYSFVGSIDYNLRKRKINELFISVSYESYTNELSLTDKKVIGFIEMVEERKNNITVDLMKNGIVQNS